MTYNIIGDIAGRFDELMLLLPKMPKADKTILVGDLVDRGPKSNEVINWAMTTPNVIAIKGNHEDMMVDFYEDTKRYEEGIWFMNGGDSTIESYGCKLYPYKPSNEERIRKSIPKEHIEWLKQLPVFYKDEGLFVSHAPWSADAELGEVIEYARMDDSVLWNRYPPKKHDGVFQIYGHNSSLKQYGNHAICIDNCSQRVLTGLHWPTKEIFEQQYLNEFNPERS